MWRALFVTARHLDVSLKAVAWPSEVVKQRSEEQSYLCFEESVHQCEARQEE